MVLAPMVSRLAAKHLEAVTKFLEESAAPHKPDPFSIHWEPFYDLVNALKNREQKAKPKSALKQAASANRPKIRK